MSRAPRQSPLQQWAALRQHEAAIIQQLEAGGSLGTILPKYGITLAYWHKYKSPAQQAAVVVAMQVKRMHAWHGIVSINLPQVTNNQ